jgi:hypothetical protein
MRPHDRPRTSDRGRLLAGTALVGAALGIAPGAASAEPGPAVTPGGKLEITITGFSRFLWAVGDVKEKLGGEESSSDFRNDTEVHIVARGEDPATGLRYGATVEFEADTNRTDNTDETWVILAGGFGELRLGDQDGAAEKMQIGGFSVAVGTGGIDGTVVDTGEVTFVANTDDATKIAYYSPILGGFQLGVSYTPNANSDGDNLAVTNIDGFKDWIEAGLVWSGELGEVGVQAGVVGGWARANFGNGGDDELGTIFAGASIELFGFGLAGGLGTEEVAGVDRDWLNLGVQASFGPVDLSATYGQATVDPGPDPRNLVLGAELGLVPGVALSAEVSFFDEDRGADDDGVLGVVRLAVDF